jgi:Protein of unknown function (DUF1036)
MALHFYNLYRATIWIAFLYHDSSCRGTPWKKQGWWQVDSGQIFTASNADLRRHNRHTAFYADNGGGAVWRGSGNNWYRIPAAKGFRQCFDDNWDCNLLVNFWPLDFNGFYDVTVTLGPRPLQRKVRGRAFKHKGGG